MSAQVWLHRPLAQSPPVCGRRQSQIGRQLLKLACRANGIDLSPEVLAMPGLALLERLQQQHHMTASISHCKHLVAIALSRHRLGIDCEAGGRRNDCQGIADTYFHPAEADTIRRSDALDTEQTFLRHWVLKESMVKAHHGSVLNDLNMLTLDAVSGAALIHAPAFDREQWHIWQGQFAQCYLGLSIASASRPSLTFLECRELQQGVYARCNDAVTGTFLDTAASGTQGETPQRLSAQQAR